MPDLPLLELIGPRKRYKESLFSTYEEQRDIAQCSHKFLPRLGLLFGYLPVDYQCDKCGTWKSPSTSSELVSSAD